MKIQILNSFHGDDTKDIDTSTDDGRASAAKLMNELLRSGSAVFLEREVDGETKTYRVTGYDPATDKLTIRADEATPVEETPKKHGRTGPRGRYRKQTSTLSASTGRMVSVAPVSGGSYGD
jgi:hypothetical protein